MHTDTQHSARLSALLRGLPGQCPLPPALDRDISGVELDSRLIVPGSLFMACGGQASDGRRYIDDAIERGASAVLVEEDERWSRCEQRAEVPLVPVAALPERMHLVAARFYGEPAALLKLVGITGTNGKTSCVQLLARLLAALGRRCGVIGTLGYGVAGEWNEALPPGPGTTPDAVTLQRILARLAGDGVGTVVMEVSSHGLEQYRVNVDDFAVAVFTNLSRDHLDYHSSLERYGASKRRLFGGLGLRTAVLNLDDDYSAGTRALLAEGVRCLSWSVGDSRAEVHAASIAYSADGIDMRVRTPWGEFATASKLLGAFNASNLLAVLAAALALESEREGFDPARVVAALQQLQPVPGRMQLVGRYPVSVVVDYAHTPDALEKALQAVRLHCEGRLWCVFGCGGERDTGKRPEMAAVAEGLADRLIVTDDNPRGEDSAAIIADIVAGLREPARAQCIPRRADAVAAAISQAAPGDLVLLAGKGHEDYQEVRGRREPFSDAGEASRALRRRFDTKAEEPR